MREIIEVFNQIRLIAMREQESETQRLLEIRAMAWGAYMALSEAYLGDDDGS